jgi:hypothetical protein
MADIQTVGWGSRLGKSIVGALIGVVLFVVAFPLLLWNEYNSVQTIRALEEGAGQCVTVAADKVDDANNGKLIHTTGEATTAETLKDDQFGVSANALKLTRKAEIYQWVERSETKTEKRAGGKEEKVTSFYHDKKWVEKPVDSTNFRRDDATGELYENVGKLPYTDSKVYAREPKLGAFKLTTPQQVDDLDTKVPAADKALPVTKEMLAALPKDVKDRDWLTVKDGAFYLPYKGDDAAPPKDDETQPKDEAKDPNGDAKAPQIGDVRVTFLVVKPQKISVMAKQDHGSFVAWKSSNGKEVNDLRTGAHTKEQMFEQLQGENTARTWLLRLVGFALMAGGIFLVGRPVAVFSDFLPAVGTFVEGVLLVIAVILALPLTLMTIAVSWVLVRPLIALPILAVGVLLLGGAVWFIWSRRRAKPAVAVATAR